MATPEEIIANSQKRVDVVDLEDGLAKTIEFFRSRR